jgi:hypothetical protein
VQKGYGALFAVMVQILLSITRVAVQFVSEPEISHDAGFQLRAAARVRAQLLLLICLGAGAKAKSVTNNLPILSVLALAFYFNLCREVCLRRLYEW